MILSPEMKERYPFSSLSDIRIKTIEAKEACDNLIREVEEIYKWQYV